MHKLTYSRAALADLGAIDDFIALDSPARAASYVADIRAYCRQLCRHPQMGPAREDLGQGIRTFSYRRRVVVAYRVLVGEIRIVRVYYAGRQR